MAVNGYTRQSAGAIVTGAIIQAGDLNNEFNQLQTAFDISVGHTHDGTVGGGQAINISNVVGTVTVARGGTGIAAGVSGGILYFSSTSTAASSALLTANALIVGGGAATAPATLASTGTTTTVLHGNAAGLPSFGAIVLTTDVSGILPGANGGTNNGFMAFTGPTTSLKTFTVPNASDTLVAYGTAGTFTANQSHNSGTLILKGSGSGTITLNAAAVAGSNTITLPAGTTDFSATGGASQVVKQTSSGGAFTVAQLAASDLTNGVSGSGAVVLVTGASLITPTLGVATATTINKVTITAPASSAILTIADGKTFTVNQTLTFTGTSGQTFTFPATTDTVAVLGTVQSFTKQQNITNQALTSTSNSIAWDANAGNQGSHTATENTTLANPTNLVTGGVYIFQWTQHASAAKTLAFGTKWKFQGSSTVSATTSSVQIFTALYDGTNLNTVMTGPFS